jgi:predicted ATPase
VAYGTVLDEQRKALHERTGQAMEGLYRTSLGDHYSDLAHHYSRGGNTQKAVEYLGLAGHQGVQRSANDEAIGHFTTAIELLQTLPDTLERNQQELTLQVALAVPLTATKSPAAPEVGNVYVRARQIVHTVQHHGQIFVINHVPAEVCTVC